MKSITNILVILLSLMINNIFSQTNITLSPVSDVTIKSNSPLGFYENESISCGIQKITFPRTSIVESRTLLKFDVANIPENAIIISANLKLFSIGHNNPKQAFIQPIVENWDESTVSWSSQPLAVETGQILLDPIINQSDDYTLDISFFVENWIKGVNNRGMLFRIGEGYIGSNFDFNFASSDYYDYSLRPVLEISYVLPIEMSYTITSGTLFGTYNISTNTIGGVPPYTYTWSNGSATQNISNVTEGFYNLKIRDAIGFEKNYSISIKDYYTAIWGNLKNIQIIDNKIYSTADYNSEEWSSGASTINKIESNTDGGIKYVLDSFIDSSSSKAFAIGLNENDESTQYTEIDYCILFNYNIYKYKPAFGLPEVPKALVYENGILKAECEIPLNEGAVYEITRTGNTINYIVNGIVVHQTTTDPNKSLIADVSLLNPNNWVAGVEMTEQVQGSSCSNPIIFNVSQDFQLQNYDLNINECWFKIIPISSDIRITIENDLNSNRHVHYATLFDGNCTNKSIYSHGNANLSKDIIFEAYNLEPGTEYWLSLEKNSDCDYCSLPGFSFNISVNNIIREPLSPCCTPGTWITYGEGFNGQVNVLKTINGTLFAGGSFTQTGLGLSAKGIAKWNGSNWENIGTGLNGSVYSIEEYQNTLYVAGQFQENGDGTIVNSIAKWDISMEKWLPLGSGSDIGVLDNNNNPGWVTSLAVFNNELVLGGLFKKNLSCLTTWDGNNWTHSIQPSVQWGWSIRDLVVDLSNNQLWVGGAFIVNGVTDLYGMGIWNGSNWSTPNGSISSGTSIKDMHIDNNMVYVGGSFSSINGITTGPFAFYDLLNQTWSTYQNNFSFMVTAITYYNGAVYLFENPFNAVSHFLWWDELSQAWEVAGGEVFNEGSSFETYNNELIVGGSLNSIGGSIVKNVVKLCNIDNTFDFDFNTTNCSCNNSNDGTITLSLSNGESPYDFQWSNGATTQNLSGISAGTYAVTVTDANECSVIKDVTITEPAQQDISTIITSIKCYGNSNGAISLTVTGGTSPYTYLWSNGTTNFYNNNLPAGTYTVTVTDFNNCINVATTTITQPTQISLSISETNVACYNDLTGSITVETSGGIPEYHYSWSSGQISNSITNKPAGAYTVTVTDANGCTATSTATISQPTSALTANITGTNASCYGGTDGAVDLTVAGGITPYNYLWSNSATTEDLSGLSTGTYDVTVTDANNCQIFNSVIISEPELSINGECCTRDYDEIIGTGTGTVTYNTNTTFTGNYLINVETLELKDAVYTVTEGTVFYMVKDAAINLQNATFIMNGAKITAECDDMWYGIFSHGGANITIQGVGTDSSEISDSKYGIRVSSELDNFNISNSRFINNFHSSIYISDQEYYSSSNNDIITNNRFDSDPTTMLKPFNDQRDYDSEMFFVSENHIHIKGYNSSTLINNNLFKNAINGVFAPTSFENVTASTPQIYPEGVWYPEHNYIKNTINIQSNIFKNLAYYSIHSSNILNYGSSVSIPLSTISGNTIYMPAVNLTNFQGSEVWSYYDNTFINPVAILAEGNAMVDGNIITGTGDMENIVTWGISGAEPRQVTVQNNHITNVSIAMTLHGNYPGYLIQNNTINQTKLGIAVEGCRVIGNTITNIVPSELSTIDWYWGMYDHYGIMNSTKYSKITGNNISGSSSANPATGATYGILSYYTKYIGSDIFKNTFTGTDVGIQTQSYNNYLNIRCNTFAADGNPHNLASWISFDKLPQQGNDGCNNPSGDKYAAGNEWKESCNGTSEIDIVIDNAANYFDYWGHYRDESDNFTTWPQCSTPFWEVGYMQICVEKKKSTSCDLMNPNTSKSPTDPGYINEIDNQLTVLNSGITTSEQLLQSGDVQSLKDMINADKPEGQLKNALIAASPYLSDRVLIAAIESKPTPLAPGIVKEIIVANSPVTTNVYTAVANRNLPQGIMNQINAVQTGVSERDKLESRISYYEAQAISLKNMKTEYYYESGDISPVITMLENSTDAADKITLAEIYMQENNYPACNNALNDAIAYSDAGDIYENHLYVELLSMIIDLANDGKTIFDMNQTQEQLVRDIAVSETQAAGEAQLILMRVFHELFVVKAQKLNPATARSLSDIDNVRKYLNAPVIEFNNDIKIYPNPSKGDVELYYNFEENKNGKITFFDCTGRKVSEYNLDADKNKLHIPGDKLENGIYTYRVVSGNIVIKEDKLVIIK